MAKKNKGFVELGFAKVDLDRRRRQGIPEVIFGLGKTAAQIIAIAKKIHTREKFVLITRVDEERAQMILQSFPQARWNSTAQLIEVGKWKESGKLGKVAVVCAGTSDLPVAEEAAATAEIFGAKVSRIYDVGVAGLHRLLAHLKEIRRADVIIVVAGMEGALPSVVAGLVDKPVIAVPTSIGYGASYKGIAALLGMMNSCGSGVVVVNIDNGFGAAFAAHQMLKINR